MEGQVIAKRSQVSTGKYELIPTEAGPPGPAFSCL